MKTIREQLSPLQILGWVVSAIITIALLVMGQDSLASLTVGLLGAVLTQLLQVQINQREAEEHLLGAVGLNNQLFRDPWLSKQLRRLADDYLWVKNESKFDYFEMCAEYFVHDCSLRVHAMTEGSISVPHRTPLALEIDDMVFAQAKLSIWSVVGVDMGYWRSAYAQKFIEQNAKAQQRGVEVVRLFVQPKNDIAEIRDILQHHKQSGIQVYVVYEEDLQKDLDRDYHLVDSRVLTEVVTSIDQRIIELRVSILSHDVENWVKRFNITRRYATLVDDKFLASLENADPTT